MNRALLALVSLLLPTVVAVFYFGAAGRVDLPAAWAVIGVLAAFGLVIAISGDRDLMAERVRPKGPNLNKVGQRVASFMLFIHWIVSGLDAGRYGWTPVAQTLRWVGVGGYTLAVGFVLWAVQVNRFYSSVVRLQSDRGQVPIETGPYRVVRHPGYAATMLAALTGGMALGSWLGIVPLLVVGALFLHRTRLEDSMLRAELTGYAGYAARVRYRLVPGVW